ncbi:MAG: TolB family protein [Armatimonadota bacterium]
MVIRRVDNPQGLSIYPAHPDPVEYNFWEFSFTRDSTSLLWSSIRLEGSTLMTANADGSDVEKLGVNGGSPSFSPDGRLIACDTMEDAYTHIITVLTTDGKRVGRLPMGINPFFSADGRTLYFNRLDYDRWKHFNSPLLQMSIAPDGTLGTPTASPLPSESSDWHLSADGTTFFFARLDGIYRVQVDGTGLTRLTTGEQDQLVCVSPEGAIAFCRNRTLYLLDRNSTKPREMTRIHIEERYPAQATFTPDGRSLVFLDQPVWYDADADEWIGL